MKTLNQNWLTEGLIDFEYKKYTLLAYLQYVSKNFNAVCIYPFLSDLIYHHKNLKTIKENKQYVSKAFPKTLKKIDLDQFKIEYEQKMHDYEYLSEIQEILEFAIPEIGRSMQEGMELYDFVERHITISPIGIIPLNTEFGYLFIKEKNKTETTVFEYSITIFENAEEQFRGLKTSMVGIYRKTPVITYESIKINLLQKFKTFSNPATFLVYSKLNMPFEETLFPVARRSFIRYLSGQTK
jgi:hypothetical protein